jgi:hypothetical protein
LNTAAQLAIPIFEASVIHAALIHMPECVRKAEQHKQRRKP